MPNVRYACPGNGDSTNHRYIRMGTQMEENYYIGSVKLSKQDAEEEPTSDISLIPTEERASSLHGTPKLPKPNSNTRRRKKTFQQ